MPPADARAATPTADVCAAKPLGEARTPAPDPAARRGATSIRRRVLGLALVVLVLAGCAVVLFLQDYAERAADRAFDRLLAASALSIAGAVQVEAGRATVELPFASLAMLGSGSDRVFYVVSAPDSAFVTGYADLGEGLVPARSPEPVFENRTYRGEPVRIATIGRLTSATEAAGFVTIRVAETRLGRTALASEIFNTAVAPLVGLLLVALALVWFGVQRAFAPLADLERELRERPSEDLSPVTVPVPVEVGHLVEALNGFMRRLDTIMRTLSSVVADAAHQVRTPLASLRAQAEVALDEPDYDRLHARVVKIHNNAVVASDLINQLLMEAIVAHRIETREVAVLSVGTIVDDVLQRLDPGEAARVRVDVPPAAAEAAVTGDRLALREMLRNLVDNALVHADGPVELAVAEPADGVVALTVADRGPGIPDDEKGLVLERFHRGRTGGAKSGTGLGLSIVRTVVEAHRGAVVLADRPGGGLAATVTLPLHRAERPTVRGAARTLAVALAVLAPAVLASFAMALADAGPAAAESRTTTYPAPRPPEEGPGPTLTIAGATDTPLFAHFVRDFQALRPDVTVVYAETDTLPLYDETVAGRLPPSTDLVVSSAADLQVKLANDGYALAHSSPATERLPAWAKWRSEVFGFTFEPAVIVYNRDLVPEKDLPHSHLGLTELLERDPDRFRGRVGTYDIATSGVGHMLAAQDALISSNFWRLARAFGRVDARLSGSSPEILDLVGRGELALGYNVLGSYAFARLAGDDRIGIVIPDDYALVLTRAMLIPRSADDPDLARAFIDYALSDRGQAIAAGAAALGAVVPGVAGRWTAEAIAREARGIIQPVALGPALLVSLDQERKARILETWRQLVSGQ